MKELHQLLTASIDKAMTDGTFEEIINKRVNETLADMVKSAFMSYGGPGKALKEKIEASLMRDIDRLSFPEYSHFIQQAVGEHFTATMDQHLMDTFKPLLAEITEPVPKRMTGQQFMDGLNKLLRDEIGEEGGEIEVRWGEREETIFMEFADFKITFYNWKHRAAGGWHIGYIEDDAGHVLSRGLSGRTHAIGVPDRWLFQLYCTGTIITDLDSEVGCNLVYD